MAHLKLAGRIILTSASQNGTDWDVVFDFADLRGAFTASQISVNDLVYIFAQEYDPVMQTLQYKIVNIDSIVGPTVTCTIRYDDLHESEPDLTFLTGLKHVVSSPADNGLGLTVPPSSQDLGNDAIAFDILNLNTLHDGHHGGGGTTYGISAEIATGGANLRLTGSDASTDEVKLAAGSNVTIDRTDANTITISAAGGSSGGDVSSVAGRTGDVVLTKEDVGLSNVDNTSDLEKPISTATQTALDGKAAASHQHVSTDITDFTSAVVAATPTPSWNTLTDKPTTFPPENHIHPISEITGLQDALDDKQATLESGTNIKTINGTSILGAGDITITTSGTQVNSDWNSTSGASEILNKPTTLAGYGITDAAPLSHTSDEALHLTTSQNTLLDSITATATEINYLTGVTSAIQTQLDSKQSSLGYTAENVLNKGAVNGYASLDSSGKVPSTQLPSYVDDVLEFANLAAIQATAGESGKIYIALDTNKVYRWSGSTYIEIVASPGSTDNLPEGSTNLYFTAERAQAAVTTISGNAATATKLSTSRSISASGDATWSVNFDGSQDVTAELTLSNTGVTAGTYKSITVNEKGLVTGGTNPTTLSDYGITDAAPLTHVTDESVHLTSSQNTLLDSITATATEINYLTGVTSAIQTQLDSKQATLESGTNIKTINGTSVLGAGDITITTSNPLTVSSNVGLSLTNDNLSTIYNTTISDTVQSVAVGGAAATAASTWKTKTIVQVLDDILFPDVLPTYTVPTITLTGSQSGTKEVGEAISQALTLAGIKNDAGAFTSLSISRTGVGAGSVGNTSTPTTQAETAVPDQFGYANPNNPNTRYVYTVTDSFTVGVGSTSWAGTSNYNAGLAKKNNKGVTDNRAAAVRTTTAPQAAGTSFNSTSLSVNGIYPYYWGVSTTQPTTTTIAGAIQNGSASRVLADSTGTVSVTFNATGQYVWFAHAGIYTTKTKWYNTELNQGSIGAGNFILAPENQNMTANNGRWTNVSYKVYISSGATTTNGSIQFRNS